MGDSPLAMRHHSAGDARMDLPQRPLSDGSEFSASLQRGTVQEVLLCEDEQQRGSVGSQGSASSVRSSQAGRASRGSVGSVARPPGMVSSSSLQEEELAGIDWSHGGSAAGVARGSAARSRGSVGSTHSESAGGVAQ